MNLNDIRLRLRIAGRNANDPSYYSNAAIDEAAQRLFARFLRVTRLLKTVVTVPFTGATSSSVTGNLADFSTLGGFLPDRIETARIVLDSNYTVSDVCEDLRITSSSEVYDHQSHCGTSTGTPKMMGFLSTTSATFHPPASADGTMSVRYSTLGETWTPGTMGAYSSSVTYYLNDVVSSAGNLYRSLTNANVGNAVSVTTAWANLGAGTAVAPENVISDIPDALLAELIGTGGPPLLQAVDPEHQLFVGAAWTSYLQFEQNCVGLGSISGKSSTGQPRFVRDRW